MLNSLQITAADEQLNEIDGVPITGQISVAKATAQLKGESIVVKWKSFQPKEKLKLYITATNNFKTGTKDNYKMVKTVISGDSIAEIDVSNMPANQYKVMLKGKHNTTNVWVVR
jgi:hypothetical protein